MPFHTYPTDRLMLSLDNLQTLIAKIKEEATIPSLAGNLFPIGYVWVTSKAPDNGGNPNILFPGTYWKRIKGCFIWAADDADTVDDVKRGRNTVSTADLPYHTHKSGGYTGEMSASSDGGYTGTFTCSKNSSGSWENSGIVNNREQTGSGSYGGSGTAYQTSRYTLNIQHKHSVPATAGNYKSGSTVQTATTMDITNVHINRYCWERITLEEYNAL